MKHFILVFCLLFFASYCVAQENFDESIFDYSTKPQVKKKEKVNDSPYAMFGDNTPVLKTDHERDLNHSLKIPLFKDEEPIGLFELNFLTAMATIKDLEDVVILEQKLSSEQMSRFLTVDPHAENYYSWSPYAYCGNNPIKFIDPNGMDWYEDKDGNVSWVNENDEDNKRKVKGWKHLGDRYMGIKISQSQVYEDRGVDVIQTSIYYKNESGEDVAIGGWIQTVDTDAAAKGGGNQFVDPYEDNGNYPFYDSKKDFEYNTTNAKEKGFDAHFYDSPFRNQDRGNYKWSAETSLIKKNTAVENKNIHVNGYNIPIPQVKTTHSPVVTLQWGFYRQNGKTGAYPIRVVSGSSFHKNAIQRANK